MKAAVYYENGPPLVLRCADMPDPVVGPTDVLIRVESVSIEGGDILSRQLVPPPRRPHIVGYQAAGEVVAIGTNVERIRVGQRVADHFVAEWGEPVARAALRSFGDL